MAFTSIVIGVIVVYVLVYAGMIVYDLFLKKEPVEFMPKPKDVDIDISDEAGQFKPIAVENTEPQQPSALNSVSHKSDDEVVTARPIPDGDSKETIEEEKLAIASAKQSAAQTSPPPPLSATSFELDSDKPKEKPSDDIGPRPTDEETQKRINELVKLRRGEILSEEMSALSKERENMKSNEEDAEKSNSKEDNIDASTDKTAEVKDAHTENVEPTDPEVHIVGFEHTVSPKVSDTAGEEAFKESTPSESNSEERPSKRPAHTKKSRAPKPPKQPEFHSNAYFDILKVQIDDSKQQTKLQGAQTAEQVSKEAMQVSLDEAQMTLRQINNLWEKKESERVLDEDELQAIEKSERSNREAPPEFNI
jgi:hypothetical protein